MSRRRKRDERGDCAACGHPAESHVRLDWMPGPYAKWRRRLGACLARIWAGRTKRCKCNAFRLRPEEATWLGL